MAACDEFVPREVVAAVVTGGERGRVSAREACLTAAGDDYAGWCVGAGRARESRIAGCESMAAEPAVRGCAAVPDSGSRPLTSGAWGERRGVRPAPPRLARTPRWSKRAEAVDVAGRFSSPLVLLGSAAVSMVLLSLASIGMVRDVGSPPLPRAVEPAMVPAAGEMAAELPGAGDASPVIAGSDDR